MPICLFLREVERGEVEQEEEKVIKMHYTDTKKCENFGKVNLYKKSLFVALC